MAIPTELVNKIIDEVFFNTGTVDSPTLSALALVSHVFRQHTNTHRFSDVSFMERIEPISIIHEFLNLLKSDVWAPAEGVARHVKIFSVALGAIVAPHNDLGPHPSIADGSITAILNLIFQRSSPDRTDFDHTLGLATYARSGYPSLFKINKRNSWDVLVNPPLVAALQGLLNTRSVTHLILMEITDVPPTLLAASYVHKLTLRKVQFKLSDPNDRTMSGPMVHLQDLQIDTASLAFSQAFDHFTPGLGFPAVKYLRYFINLEGTFWTSPHPWKHLGALETLSLDIIAQPAIQSAMPTITQYCGHLQSLKKLIIEADTNFKMYPYRITHVTGEFLICDLFLKLLPYLPTTYLLELSFRNTDSSQQGEEGFASVFGHYQSGKHFAIIDLALTVKDPIRFAPPMLTLRFTVYIADASEGFDVEEYCQKGYLFIEESFPQMNSGQWHKTFDKAVSKYSPSNGTHHYNIVVSVVFRR